MHVVQMAAAAGLPEELVSRAKQSRSEKKARKAMSKLGRFGFQIKLWEKRRKVKRLYWVPRVFHIVII